MSKHGTALQDVTRRQWMRYAGRVGLGIPLTIPLLGTAPAARAQAAPFLYAPTRRGGGGTLRILSWQGATILNPHFASGAKDTLAARLFYEPLASYDLDGSLYPVLAAEVPTLANGGVARDGLSVTFKLKRGVVWHDGEPFDADDVVFTTDLLANPDTAAFTIGSFQGVKARKLDSHTVRFEFDKPRPAWDDLAAASVLPKRHFAAYTGTRSREAPANLRPVGTGPYRIVDFRPGDSVRAEANAAYHMPNRPHFDLVEIKGGGDSVSAARAVVQTGEYDLAWQLQVEDEVLRRIEAGGRGRVQFAPSGHIEYIMLNFADPSTEVDGERSHASTRNPMLGDPAVRRALAHLVDRDSVQRHVTGRSGEASGNFLNLPAQYRSSRQVPAFDPARANTLLDAAGWARERDGVRAKGSQRLKMLFQTSTNAPRQKVQAIVKSAAASAGIEMELKAVVASVYFSSDAGNPDTAGRFQADLQMHTTTRAGPDPGRLMELFCSWQIASKANKWIGRNPLRWRNDEYDRLFRVAESELDPARRTAMLVSLNDIVCGDDAVIPIVTRTLATAMGTKIRAPIGGWGIETSRIQDWYRSA